MPKYQPKTKTYILTAGEISTYSLCPEAWRLQYLKKVETLNNAKVEKARDLHKKWANDIRTANFFSFGTRMIFYLFVLIVFSFVIPVLI